MIKETLTMIRITETEVVNARITAVFVSMARGGGGGGFPTQTQTSWCKKRGGRRGRSRESRGPQYWDRASLILVMVSPFRPRVWIMPG